MLRFEKYLFYFLVLLALSIIVIPKYYITGDGASHTYNAKVLFDFVTGEHRDFYEHYFVVNRHIDPNWSSHIIIGFFTRFCPPWLADKFFQIIYVLVFCFGFRFLIRSIKKENSFLSFLFFPFLFTLPFQQGFYNYCLSLGFLFWSVGFYIRHRKDMNEALVQFITSVLVLCTALSHGMPAIYAMMLISLIWIFEHLKAIKQFDIKFILEAVARLALVFLPTLLLIGMFLAKRGFGTTPHPKGWLEKFWDFIRMWTSQSTRHTEVYPAVASFILILLYIGLLLFNKNKDRLSFKNKKTQLEKLSYVFLVFAAFIFYSYITSPNTIGGAGSIEIRLAFLPLLFLLLFLATKEWNELPQTVFIAFSFLISITFLVLRFPTVMKTNAIAQEIMQGNKYIEDESVVLNLHYDDWQKTNHGDSLFQLDNSFLHLTDYYGAERNKHLIMLLNYEADINYFPVNWAAGKNPRHSINTMFQGYYPPCGDFRKYEQQAGRKIDYIILQNWDDNQLDEVCTKNLFSQMALQDFTKKYESPHKYIVVWGR